MLAAQSSPPPPLQPAAVLAHVKDSISWYRQVKSAEQDGALDRDVLLRDSTDAAALKAVELAFDFGQAAASLVDAPGSGRAPGAAPANPTLSQGAARAAERVSDLQSRLGQIDASLPVARGAARDTLRAQRDAVAAELALATEVRDTVNTLAAFAPATGTGLGAEVQELETLVPEAQAARPNGKQAGAHPPAAAGASAGTGAARAQAAGIFGLASELFGLSHDYSLLRQLAKSTGTLDRSLDRVRAPLLNEVRSLVAHSQALNTATGSETAQQLAADRQEIQAIAARFHQLAAVLVPLGEQKMVLGTARADLAQALDGIDAQWKEAGQSLLLRLCMLGLGIGAVVLLSSIWRRVTFRYVPDGRRRMQFLTVRRLVVACLIFFIVVLSFVTEFGSLATYAGLLTAGIAVALQNVILSVVAYFFLIGRYGMRGGDRVTISGVTGTVIEVGLVRLYLAELAGSNGDLRPTGRVVVYSNSVLFQPAALFKHMGSTDYVWHTVRLVLTAESDFALAEKRISKAAETVYENYRQAIEKQHAEFERSVDAHIAPPKPDVRLRYVEEGLEALVLYPTQPDQAPLADSQMLQSIQQAVAREAKLTLASAGEPRVVASAA